MLQWARANGCNWGRRVFRNAAKNGHFHVLKWLEKMDAPGSRWRAFNAANDTFEVKDKNI